MRFALPILMVYALSLCLAGEPADSERRDRERTLILSAYNLDVEGVRALLNAGTNVHARLGKNDSRALFQNGWTLGWFMEECTKSWTPLQAVANSHHEPQPQEPTENSEKGLAEALKKMKQIDPKIIAERKERRIKIAQMLLDSKADINAADDYGETPLYAAVYNDYEDLALLLINAGAKVDVSVAASIDGTNGISILHRAVSSPILVEALLKRKAKVDVLNERGESALHWAIRDGNVESVRLLLAAGADPERKNSWGDTPLESAADNSFDPEAIRTNKAKIRELLRKSLKSSR